MKSERFGDYEYLAQFNVRADNDEIDSIEDLVNSEGLVWHMAIRHLLPDSCSQLTN